MTAGADLVDAGDGTTLLKWSGQAEARGPIAAVGGRVLDAQAQKADRGGVRQRPPAVDGLTPPVPADVRGAEECMTDLFEQIAALRREGQSFALATVVGAARAGVRAPRRSGDRVRRRPHGGIRRRSVLARDRQAAGARRLDDAVQSPGVDPAGRERPGHVDRRARGRPDDVCRPRARLTSSSSPSCRRAPRSSSVATPVAESLARLARSMDYDVVRVVEARERRDVEQRP